MPDYITSIQNPKIKNLILLQSKRRERKLQNRIVVEGYREISRAENQGYTVKELYFCPQFDTLSRVGELASGLNPNNLVEISPIVFSKIAYRESSEGFVALLEPVYYGLDQLKYRKNPLILVLESIEKPGNLGAILRTADAAAVDAIIVCDPLCDIYNPNVIRSSLGCIFSVPVVACTTPEAIEWLNAKGINSYAAELNASGWYYLEDYREGTAFVLGTEATGLSNNWLKGAGRNIKIPMLGIADSLNVSITAAVLVYEAMRQRDFENKLFKNK